MTNNASSSAIHTLTSRIADVELRVSEQPSLAINLGEAIEPLRMGGVTFYGESARVIRDAQAVLQAAGAGQLEVVERANEPGEPFVVIEGQVFINDAAIKSTTFTVKPVLGANGQYHFAGFGVGIEQATGSTAKTPVDAGLFLSELTKQIAESKLVASLDSRIAEIEKSGVQQGAENRAICERLVALECGLGAPKEEGATKKLVERRLEDLQAQITMLIAKSCP